MANPIHIWVVDDEPTETLLRWSRIQPAKTETSSKDGAIRSAKDLTIHPGLEGCDLVEVYVNDSSSPLQANAVSIPHSASESEAPFIPDDRFPDCSVWLTYLRLESPQEFSSFSRRDRVWTASSLMSNGSPLG